MGIFIAALIATLIDYRLLNNSVGFIALGAGVFVAMSLIALKADGRDFPFPPSKKSHASAV